MSTSYKHYFMWMQTSDMVSWEYGAALEKFVENMDIVVSTSEYNTTPKITFRHTWSFLNGHTVTFLRD